MPCGSASGQYRMSHDCVWPKDLYVHSILCAGRTNKAFVISNSPQYECVSVCRCFLLVKLSEFGCDFDDDFVTIGGRVRVGALCMHLRARRAERVISLHLLQPV